MQIRIIPRAAAAKASRQIVVLPTSIVVTHRPMRVLDFDVECRPLHFYGEYVSKDITAIAWAWVDQPGDVECVLQGEMEQADMLRAFLHVYNQADMVTGHYIRGFDLPLINGALSEHQMPPLGAKLTQDTKIDLMRRHGMSGSQENLGATLELEHPKVGMNQAMWRKANRLEPEGLAYVRERVTGDVKQHIEMRKRLLELGYLSAPVLWKSGGTRAEAYTP